MSYKFGDIVINEWAGRHNPQKVGIVISSTKIQITCTDGLVSWHFANDRYLLRQVFHCGMMLDGAIK